MSVSWLESDAIQTQNGKINLWRSEFSLGLNLSSISGACKRAIHMEMYGNDSGADYLDSR